MNILIAYATNSGGTEMCAQIIYDVLNQHKHKTKLAQIKTVLPKNLTEHDLVLLGSPSWDFENQEGMPHQDVMALVKKCDNEKLDLAGYKFCVFGCGDRSYTFFCRAVDKIEEFLKKHGATLTSDSLKIDSFFFDMERNIEKVEIWAQTIATSIST